MAKSTNANPGHETTDASAGPVVGVGIAIAVLVGASIIAMIVFFKVLDYYQPFFDATTHPLSSTRHENTEPRVQIDPPVQKLELRKIEENLLNGYGWIDQGQGIARIPVQRAMEIVAANKLNVSFNSGVADSVE